MPNWDELFKAGKFGQQEPTWGVRRFAAFLGEGGRRRVLDIGCGAGRHLLFLAEEGFVAYGLDLSGEALKLAHRRLRGQGLTARLVRADMTSLPFPDGCLDAVIAVATLYHGTLSALRQAVEEIHRVLKPGGLALLEFKSRRSFRYGKGEEVEPHTFIAATGDDAGIPHHYSDREEVEALVRDFVLHEINHMERIFEGLYHSGRWEVWVEKPGQSSGLSSSSAPGNAGGSLMAELGVARLTYYFHSRGEVNTQKVLELARDRALELKIEKMVVASETGRSALKALSVLEGTDIQLIVVTHPPATTTGPKGEIPIGLSRPEYRHVKRHLEAQSAVIVQGTRPFGGIGRALGWKAAVPATFVDKTLELFGSGTKIAVEVAIMATDAGAVEAGETVVTLGGTFKGLDTALVVKTAYSYNAFAEFEVLEVIAKPLRPGKRLPEYEQEAWKGDVEQYYKPIEL